MSSDRERLAQLRLHATLRESDQQNKHHGDLQWLLSLVDALEAFVAVYDRFAQCVAEFPRDPYAWDEYIDWMAKKRMALGGELDVAVPGEDGRNARP